MDNEILKVGRQFLVLLHKTEELIKAGEITNKPSINILQISRWKYALAFILRKLSAYTEGATDYDTVIIFKPDCRGILWEI